MLHYFGICLHNVYLKEMLFDAFACLDVSSARDTKRLLLLDDTRHASFRAFVVRWYFLYLIMYITSARRRDAACKARSLRIARGI